MAFTNMVPPDSPLPAFRRRISGSIRSSTRPPRLARPPRLRCGPGGGPQHRSCADLASRATRPDFHRQCPRLRHRLSILKSSTNSGRHLGYLWTSTGTLLASVTCTNESQQGDFVTPVAMDANTPYLVSYWSTEGRYADDGGYFATSASQPKCGTRRRTANMALTVPTQTGNTFPASSSHPSNHWVDVVFSTAIQ